MARGQFTVFPFEGHAGGTRCIDVDATGADVLSGGKDGIVRRWTVCSDASCLHRSCVDSSAVAQQKGNVVSLHYFAPDNGRFVSGAGRPCNSAKLWRLADNGEPAALLQSFEGHSDGVFGLRVSPMGAATLVTGGGQDDKTARVYDMESGVSLGSWRHKGSVRAIRFHPDNPALVFTGSLDKTTRLWDLRRPFDDDPVAMLREKGTSLSLAVGRTLLAVGNGRPGNAASIYDLRQLDTALTSLVGPKSAVSAVVLREGEGVVLTGSYDGSIRVHRLSGMSALSGTTVELQPIARLVTDSAHGEIEAMSDLPLTGGLLTGHTGSSVATMDKEKGLSHHFSLVRWDFLG